jgi:hypothetical protein
VINDPKTKVKDLEELLKVRNLETNNRKENTYWTFNSLIVADEKNTATVFFF